ncbi:hypothetical protein EJ110_NYTH47299 [Nymphaea thermarum]|nr:hypothetical protein EJ110_NYTH47299 [Nymphaea thermarum]
MAALCGPKRDFIDVTPGYLDLYLCIADSPTQQGKWSVVAEFSLGVVDQTSKETDKANKKDSFTAHGGIFSLPYPIPLRTLHCPEKGYLVNDTCVVEVGITVRKVVGYITYPDDSKEEASLGSDGCQSTVEKKNAYHAVLRCLHQEGEHTWKKEALLAELRVALEISSSDHNIRRFTMVSGISRGSSESGSTPPVLLIRLRHLRGLVCGAAFGGAKELAVNGSQRDLNRMDLPFCAAISVSAR